MIADARTRGRLKVFLGYAAGVGKTYQMMTEARELQRQGVDVVIDSSQTLYFKPALDLTTDAVAAYNKAYPAK